jgi:hypothetical protein
MTLQRSELQRKTPLKRGSTSLRRTPLGHCTPEQRERVRGLPCIACGVFSGPCHPAHVIDRATVSQDAADDVRACVPLCFPHHRAYDLLPYLEPRWRDSLEWAVGAVGLLRALRRITNRRWVPESEHEEALVEQEARNFLLHREGV